ncbi:MAG TPA: type II secretion system protein GspE [Lachnospiraceae bacterium]|nr:type II secretion system protein GspE [Lachnospiraceae bacterium]
MRFYKKKMRMGDILIEQKMINQEQLNMALELKKKTKKRLGDVLVEAGIITEREIAFSLNKQLGIDMIDLRGIKIPQELIGLVSGSILRKHKVLPIGFDEQDSTTLLLAMADPLDIVAQDDISIITNFRVEPRIATVGDINAVLDKYFGTEEAMSAAEQYTKEREQQLQIESSTSLQDEVELNSAPIVQIVKTMVEQAVRQRASDIHIEALERQVRIRYRIDGVLTEKMVYDRSLLSAIVTRVKIMGHMDISEKRKPQDGRITMVVDLAEYDIRVSVLPTSFGEKVVMRLTSATGLTRNKSELGLRDWELKKFDNILKNPNGIILVTGPTGSGKSTTLYTALSELNTEAVNIITVEDPVEANIAGINQVNVNPKADFTFANALRAILRQDPDIIMIGEIRDYETAAIAVQASITGHLVVSTLHTNSSAATITRLLDMGIESFLIADSIVGVIAQRLVRRLCTSCRKPRQADDEEKLILGKAITDDVVIYDACGCSICAETGYYGRIGVYEIMEIDQKLRQVIVAKSSTEKIKETAVNNGMHTLHRSSVEYVLDGMTTISEMMKVSFEG